MKSLTLHDIKMSNDSLVPLLSYLRHINPLSFEELNLSHIDISRSINEMSLMLKENTSIKRVKLISCDASLNSPGPIGMALANHTNLQELHLSSMNINAEFLNGIT